MKPAPLSDRRNRRLQTVADALLSAIDRSIEAAEDAKRAKQQLVRLAAEAELRVIGEGPPE